MEECCDRIKGLGAKARDCLPGCSLPFTHKSRRKNPDENATPEQLAAHIGLIAPNGARKAKWDWFMLGLVLYTSISVPYQLAFYAFTDWENSEFGFVCDVIIDLLYVIDIFISWRTTYYDREGMLVLDRRMARRRYLKTWFGIDVFASFPFEYLFQLILIQSPIEVPPALRLPSLVKLLRIYRLGKKINRLSSSKMFRGPTCSHDIASVATTVSRRRATIIPVHILLGPAGGTARQPAQRRPGVTPAGDACFTDARVFRSNQIIRMIPAAGTVPGY